MWVIIELLGKFGLAVWEYGAYGYAFMVYKSYRCLVGRSLVSILPILFPFSLLK